MATMCAGNSKLNAMYYLFNAIRYSVRHLYNSIPFHNVLTNDMLCHQYHQNYVTTITLTTRATGKRLPCNNNAYTWVQERILHISDKYKNVHVKCGNLKHWTKQNCRCHILWVFLFECRYFYIPIRLFWNKFSHNWVAYFTEAYW